MSTYLILCFSKDTPSYVVSAFFIIPNLCIPTGPLKGVGAVEFRLSSGSSNSAPKALLDFARPITYTVKQTITPDLLHGRNRHHTS